MSRIAIIGGGISGLSSAYYLSKLKGLNIEKIVLLEASSRVGGWIDTSRYDDGTVFEHGPRSIRGAGTVGVNTLQLVEELGLENDVLPITRKHPASKKRFIYAKNQLCPLPNAPLAVFKKQAPFSKSLAMIGWKEAFRRSVKLHDESIYDFFARRFNTELAEYLVDPLCRGVFAGDCRKLSIKSCFPDLFRLEQEHGSIIRGALRANTDRTTYDGLVGRMKAERWAMWSLRRGLTQLPTAMWAELSKDPRVELVKDARCDRLEFTGDKAKVVYRGQEVTVDHVVSSVLAKSLSGLVKSQHEILADDLAKIPVVSVGVVNLEYDDCTLPVEGFGHLIPSSEPCKVLGVIYESCIFTEHNRTDGRALRLTCMMGGAWFDEYFGNPDNCDVNTLQEVAIATVRDHLNITQRPSRTVTRLQKDCIAQYHVGHSDVLSSLEAYIDENGLPLSLVGASYRGVSVNDCIYNARLNSDAIAAKLKQS